ncbi:hypothetical protein P4O66_018807 [Electrophorus voltai]|uniref:Integrase catalytic domain-containing protein n=1 Tax=Electrophorus voltai TaxID=2609070 RepID=A0AAD8YT41_9TELE|nr:hypothetical protein P4O66_018807 [Electrophorus voltai]
MVAYIGGNGTPWRYSYRTADGSALLVACDEQGCGKVFWQFGLPEDIVSDGGPQFTFWVWKELLGKLNIMLSLTSGCHAQANLQVERVNQELCKFLRLYTPRRGARYQLPLYPWNTPASDQPVVEKWCKDSERTWEEMHQGPCKPIAAYKRKADQRRGETQQYTLWQKVWDSTRDGHHGQD